MRPPYLAADGLHRDKTINRNHAPNLTTHICSETIDVNSACSEGHCDQSKRSKIPKKVVDLQSDTRKQKIAGSLAQDATDTDQA